MRQQAPKPKKKSSKNGLKIGSLFDTNDLSTPRGYDPRSKDMPNWNLKEQQIKKKQEKLKGVKLPFA